MTRPPTAPPFVAHDGREIRADRMTGLGSLADVITKCAVCLLFEALNEREGK